MLDPADPRPLGPLKNSAAHTHSSLSACKTLAESHSVLLILILLVILHSSLLHPLWLDSSASADKSCFSVYRGLCATSDPFPWHCFSSPWLHPCSRPYSNVSEDISTCIYFSFLNFASVVQKNVKTMYKMSHSYLSWHVMMYDFSFIFTFYLLRVLLQSVTWLTTFHFSHDSSRVILYFSRD